MSHSSRYDEPRAFAQPESKVKSIRRAAHICATRSQSKVDTTSRAHLRNLKPKYSPYDEPRIFAQPEAKVKLIRRVACRVHSHNPKPKFKVDTTSRMPSHNPKPEFTVESIRRAVCEQLEAKVRCVPKHTKPNRNNAAGHTQMPKPRHNLKCRSRNAEQMPMPQLKCRCRNTNSSVDAI